MEHRWSPRRDCAIDVVIHYRPLGLIRGQTRDIGLEGMYVATGRISLPKDEAVDVSFRLGDEDNPEVHHLGAFVVHSHDDGAGLMFRDFEDRAYSALEQLLFSDTRASVGSCAR